MALARKGSRTITVEAVEYRWAVSPDSGFMTIVAELASEPGQRMEAQVTYRDGSTGQEARVTPQVVRRAIECALQDGWTPSKRGLPSFRLVDADSRVWEDGV